MPQTKIFPGELRNDFFTIRARIHLPGLSAHGALDFIIATGSPRTILSHRDAVQCGVNPLDLANMEPLVVIDQFGRSFKAVTADAVITYYNDDRDTHQVRLPVLLRKEPANLRGAAPSVAPGVASSILALDAFRNLRLELDRRREPPVAVVARF